jgi:hypothetical protein
MKFEFQTKTREKMGQKISKRPIIKELPRFVFFSSLFF